MQGFCPLCRITIERFKYIRNLKSSTNIENRYQEVKT